ncbi:MAG: hypothetical protein HQK91_00505 [Nitrospirae bacterium]|nr:hypothetical protein [Nitrospirota bacterium]MBF0539917.1 hypothetical protein [Nitrospirota bacterium]
MKKILSVLFVMVLMISFAGVAMSADDAKAKDKKAAVTTPAKDAAKDAAPAPDAKKADDKGKKTDKK